MHIEYPNNLNYLVTIVLNRAKLRYKLMNSVFITRNHRQKKILVQFSIQVHSKTNWYAFEPCDIYLKILVPSRIALKFI